LMQEHGFLGLRMSDVAKSSHLSMGTIYSHFEAKEDLLIGCANHICSRYDDLFSTLFAQQESAVETLITSMVIKWIIDQQQPTLSEILHLSLMPSVWRRAAEMRCERSNALHCRIGQSFEEIARQAVASDFTLPDAANQNDEVCLLHHGLWALSVGIETTGQSGYIRMLNDQKGAPDEGNYHHFSHNCIHLLLGYGWREPHPEALFARCRTRAEQASTEFTL